ncbi:MAG TPA: thiolase family protein [Alphaproteobacteria bacterium]
MSSYIPYGGYWSTPYARWQGSLAHLHSLEFAAHVAKAELTRRGIAPSAFDYGVLGTTVPQTNSFYGLPWATAMLGAPHVGGPTINQACATSARCLAIADQELRDGQASCALVLTADRTSNGPHLYYPNPEAPGGTGTHENWVVDNFARDPYADVSMVQTAENVARKYQIDTARQHEVVLRRYQQYKDACADGHKFLRRFMSLPFAVPDAKFRKTRATLEGDEGIHDTTADGLAKLKPVVDGGTVTFGGQTHPADGNTAVVVTSKEKARELSKRPEIEIRLAGFGQARAEPAHMPYAPVPAAKRALADADIKISDVSTVKSHNPFVVNDIVFARECGFDVMKMNNYGCSLVWGHPQGPTGLRAILELIEELEMKGGGYGLFHGCAAGDSAMAVVVEVRDAKKS